MKSLLTLLFAVSLIMTLPALGNTTGTGSSSGPPTSGPTPGPGDPIIGLPPDAGTGNCFPFGCAYNGEYQQVYTNSQFTGGPITITNLEFFNTQVDTSATAMNSGNWTISLSSTAADWNTLSPTFATNIGADNTVVFNGNLSQPWAFGDTLTINLATPFTYNPGSGLNLLMDVNVAGATAPGGLLYFDTNGYNGGGFNGNTIMGRVYGPGSVNAGYGLVTGFSTGPATVPEPSQTGLALVGLLGLVAVLHRKLSALVGSR
jgi:hypothetical protein